MKKLYVLVGVPASGKSTWIKNQVWAKDCVVVSTDEFVEDYAKECGLTYSEVFEEYMPKAVKLMADKVVWARDHGLDIIWDQTSTSIASRQRKFKMLPDYYNIAVVFKTPEADEWKRRLSSRTGKVIPMAVAEQMAFDLTLEPPTEEEGFDEIWFN
jgi:predicted kinase